MTKALPHDTSGEHRQLGKPGAWRLVLHCWCHRLAAHARFLYPNARCQRHRNAGGRPDFAGSGVTSRIHPDHRQAAHAGSVDFVCQPHGHPCAGARSHGARRQTPCCRGEIVIETLIINVLMVMMAVSVVAIIRNRNLFAVILLSGVYSFLMATVLVAMDAVDVAMTEAAVGAGISTVLLLGALYLCKSEEARPPNKPLLPLLVSLSVGGMLVYGTLGLPEFSDPQAPIHAHVAPRYLNEMRQEVDVPNVVTAVLASYRGFDTLGETTVVFTAGAGVVALLRRRRKGRKS
ncbi:MAG: DUF4040 domain-containing protein [Rhodoferax sp.]|nr:DUF4040 domain-containing protein [Rhodoferax sp.]